MNSKMPTPILTKKLLTDNIFVDRPDLDLILPSLISLLGSLTDNIFVTVRIKRSNIKDDILSFLKLVS